MREKAPSLPQAEFGQLLRGLRTRAHLTQAQLAESSGLSVDAIRKLESGARRAPYHETACALAEALGLRDNGREQFIAVAKHARLHGPPDSAIVPRQSRSRPAVVVALALAFAVIIALGLVAAVWLRGSAAYGAPTGSGRPAIHITSAEQCTSQWSLDVANNTAGTISLVSGTQSFEALSADHKAITVAPGASLDGKVVLLVRNSGASFAVAPLIYTPSWGAPDSSWRLVAKWVPDGTTLYSPPLHLTAPSARGLYHLIFAFQLELTGADVASGTNWRLGHDIWTKGNEIAKFSGEQIREAQTFGCTTSHWLLQHGYDTLSIPADAITINVG